MKPLPNPKIPENKDISGLIFRVGRSLIRTTLEKIGDAQWAVVQRLEEHAPLIQDVLGIGPNSRGKQK